MITVGLHYDVKPMFIEEFMDFSQQVVAQAENSPGHIESAFYRKVSDSNAFLLYSEWESLEDFRAFTGSELFHEVVAKTRDWFSAKPRHWVKS